MNLKTTIAYGVGMAILFSTAACVNAKGLGSNLPMIGDNETACHYILLGAKAAARGEWLEAESDYRTALKACPFDEDATLGMARCAVAEGDFQGAVRHYRTVVQLNPYDIDLISEYVLTLQQAGQIPEASHYYNHVLSLCKEGRTVVPMEFYPRAFREDGDDYNPIEMASMTHLMLALNSSGDDVKRRATEMDKAINLAPHSSIVRYYEGVLLQQAKKTGAKHPVLAASVARKPGASATP